VGVDRPLDLWLVPRRGFGRLIWDVRNYPCIRFEKPWEYAIVSASNIYIYILWRRLLLVQRTPRRVPLTSLCLFFLHNTCMHTHSDQWTGFVQSFLHALSRGWRLCGTVDYIRPVVQEGWIQISTTRLLIELKRKCSTLLFSTRMRADGWMDDSFRFLLPASMRDAAIVVTAAVIIYTATIL
jgi:hypothetical protein